VQHLGAGAGAAAAAAAQLGHPPGAVQQISEPAAPQFALNRDEAHAITSTAVPLRRLYSRPAMRET
jgi:hypothetical protein